MTYAVFPGLHGPMYRAMVIGNGAHAFATSRMLHAIRRLSVNLTPEPGKPGT